MNKVKKLDKKGFSLVELIIVIAIMAVLIGVLAPQYIKYLDKSKIGADKQLMDGLRGAVQTSLLDPNIDQTDAPGTSGTAIITSGAVASGLNTSTGFWKEVDSIVKISSLPNDFKYGKGTTDKKIDSVTVKVVNDKVVVNVEYKNGEKFEIE